MLASPNVYIRQTQSQPIRYVVHSQQLSQQSNSFNNGNIIDSNMHVQNNLTTSLSTTNVATSSTPSNQYGNNLRLTRRVVQQQKASQKREIHVIEDEEVFFN